ncbi:MAG: ATPase, T2SS/T4P/T4SS family [Phycisphaeraceae bacterium]
MSAEDTGAIEVRNAGGGSELLREPLAGVLSAAVLAGASDLHIDAAPGGYHIRLRVDGVVHLHEMIDPDAGHRLLNQIKVASGMDLEHARHPMEGQFEYYDADDLRRDVRATLIPTLGDEACHLRLLTLPDDWRNIMDLGLTKTERETIEHALADLQGLVLIAGVTGSGKTTTQYAVARSQDLENHVAVSIEDPIEFDLQNLRQVEVDEARDFSMADGLRILLRMDPDILVVGEVRDRESATTTAHAALGGRLVLATVHARDAAAAVDAMHFRAVPYYILSGALRMVIVQNLIRKLCLECAESKPIRAHEKQVFEDFGLTAPAELLSPVGCDQCAGRGYRGRTGVFEVVTIDEETAEFLATGPHQQKIRRRFRETGAPSLIVSALQRVSDHITSFEEVVRLHSRELQTARNGNGD